jgi:DNA-binding NarL/FixJ family response regulator
MRIGIVDDKAANRNILKDKLLRQKGFKVTLLAENGNDFLDKLKSIPEEQLPEVVLMDLEMPEMDGVNAIALGASFYPSIKFVVLTIFDDEDKIFRAIRAGAYGYLLKDETAETIIDMLLHMQETGAGPISPGIAHKILQMMQQNNQPASQLPNKPSKENALLDLTDREREILQLLVQGFLYKEIGAKLDISANTAKKHVMNIYQKLHINSRAQAMHLAYEKGLL